MPRKSLKKIMKELMAKKKLTAKEKKLLMKMQKGGRTWLEFFSGKPADTAVVVDQATLTKQYDELKNQVCKVCKAAFGEEGCKCGNAAPPVETQSTSGNAPVTELKEPQSQSGEGDLSRGATVEDPELERESQEMSQPQSDKKMAGGKSKSMKRKAKRSKRASKKMKW
jgi:hypothetical protein